VRALLTAMLARLADEPLAASIVGDLEEGARRRQSTSRVGAEVWFWYAAAAITLHLAVRRVADAASTLAGTRLRGLGGEVRQAARSLARTPVASGVVILTLALGFGLNTAIFSVVHGVLIRPLPFDRPDDIVIVHGSLRGEAPSLFGTSYLDYQDFARQQQTFSGLATSTYWTFTVTGTDVPLRLVGQRVTGSFFPLLGMRPHLGRWIAPADDQPGAPEVVVLSHRLWTRVFGADPNAVGREVRLNGRAARILGVMPERFDFPFDTVELWAPALDELDSIPRRSRFFTTFGRLGRGATMRDAEADLARIAQSLAQQFPESNGDWRPSLRAAVPALTKEARPRLLLLFVGVVVVLLVACVNVTTLILSRAAGRRPEFALRIALGAGRARLARLTLLESAWLGAFGLGAGLALASPAVHLLRSLAPPDLPRLEGVGLNWTVAGWAAGAKAVFVCASALAPLVWLRLWQLRGVKSATVAGRVRTWGRRALIVSQVAGAFALLAAAGLLTRSFARVLAVDPGFNPEGVATVRVFLTPPTYRTLDQQIDYVTRALDALRSAPGVVSAAAISQPPFDTEGSGTTLGAAVEGQSYAPGSHPLVAYRTASVSYFRTMGLRLLEGRDFGEDDRRGAPLVAVINRAMATRLWPGESAVGRRFEFADGRKAGWHTVIGIVNDVATDGLETAEPQTVYAPYLQRSLPFLRWMTLVARTDGDVAPHLATIRARLQAVDPRQPLYGIATMDAAIARSVAERRFSLVLMTLFAALTLLLAAMGLYGTLAQGVADRSREMGVRLALGATPSQLFRLVMSEGAGLVAIGVGLGAVAFWLGVPLIRESLFGVTAGDAWTYVAIAAVLGAATLAASAMPSRLASRTDPVLAIRSVD
jgi:putative ABC transport system permease protein